MLRIASGVSIGIQRSIDELLEKIEKELADGYRRVKLKIKPGWDKDVLAKVRDRFPDVAGYANGFLTIVSLLLVVALLPLRADADSDLHAQKQLPGDTADAGLVAVRLDGPRSHPRGDQTRVPRVAVGRGCAAAQSAWILWSSGRRSDNSIHPTTRAAPEASNT